MGAFISDSTLANIKQSQEFLQAKMVRICREIQRRLTKDEFWLFDAYDKQAEFVEALTKYRSVLFLGGNKAGKTFIGAWINAKIFRGEYPELDEGNGKGIPVRGNIGWISALDFSVLDQVVRPMFFKYAGELGVDYTFDSKKNCATHIATGNIVYFKSCESGASKYQSANVHYIWQDEEEPEDIFKEMQPRLIASNGYMIHTFTAVNGYSWSYERLFMNPKVFHVEATMYDNPHIPKEVIEEYERTLSPAEREMRVLGKYVSMGGEKIFPHDILQTLRPRCSPPLFIGDIYQNSLIKDETGGLKIWEMPDSETTYILGVDTSEGENDPTSMFLMGYKGGRTFLAAQFNKCLEPEYIWTQIMNFGLMYNWPLLVIERNSTGSAVIGRVKDNYRGQIFQTEEDSGIANLITKKLGWHTNGSTKPKMIIDTREMLRTGSFHVASIDVVEQMEQYIRDAKGKIRAQHGHDDLVMAMMLAVIGFLSLQFAPRPVARVDGGQSIYSQMESRRQNWHRE